MEGGRVRMAPVGVELIGQLTRSWLRTDWAQDRAVAVKVWFRLVEVGVDDDEE